MEQYKLVFRRAYDLLEQYHTMFDWNCLEVIQNEIALAASNFAKEMLQAVADELGRIRKMKQHITGMRIEIESYKPAFLAAFYMLEKYHLTICDEVWLKVVKDIGGPVTKFEVALMIAVVNEIECIYKANSASNLQSNQTEEKQTA